MNVDDFVHRFTFFFDSSISLFEEVAKFRAGRRLWARLLQERFGAKNPRSLRFKFHAQTSGVDLTQQQPINNIARVALQALAAVLGGTQSLHTDAYDEALATPSSETATIAIMTQNIIAEETGVADVIDPLGGSYYVETLTNEMEQKALEVIESVDARGGMFEAVRTGFVQAQIGESAQRFQEKVESGEQTVVGVNKYQLPVTEEANVPIYRPDPRAITAQYERLARYENNRSQTALRRGLDELARAAGDPSCNVFGAIIEGIRNGATHGEVVGTLRRELGFGAPYPGTEHVNRTRRETT